MVQEEVAPPSSAETPELMPLPIMMAHKLVRQRARPKILLCSDYEDAEEQIKQYRENLLAVVSDVQFPRGGVAAPEEA